MFQKLLMMPDANLSKRGTNRSSRRKNNSSAKLAGEHEPSTMLRDSVIFLVLLCEIPSLFYPLTKVMTWGNVAAQFFKPAESLLNFVFNV
ncbi:hypothetical protein Ocin01_02400 [Orchesella cincta]|uniref:Uncharacterized protein n=1 Tax=Orchesella cincta TaxID=48709 RepID=A0A1D2NGB8_ORCCI|nr:hypothetical protein Ocin01_02400 [Orchesella cincta]